MSLRSRLTANGMEQVEGAGAHATDTSATVRDEIERNIHYLLVEELGPRIDSTTGSDVGLRRQIEHKLSELLAQETAPLSAADRREITANVLDNILGYGPIQSLIDDPRSPRSWSTTPTVST